MLEKDIYLIRHSITGYNKEYIGTVYLCGKTDISLVDKGIALAEETRENANFDIFSSARKIHISILTRTKQTADILFSNIKEKEYEVNPEFDEINFGNYELSKLCMLPPKIHDAWCDDPEKIIFPDGDSVKNRAESVYSKFLDISKNEDGPIIIISSHSILRILMCKIFEKPLKQMHDIRIRNTGIIHIKYIVDDNGREYFTFCKDSYRVENNFTQK